MLKGVLEKLFKCFCGDPYKVTSVKIQEIVVKALQHKYRWLRTLQKATSLAELALLERQLVSLLSIRENARNREVYRNTLQTFMTAIGESKVEIEQTDEANVEMEVEAETEPNEEKVANEQSEAKMEIEQSGTKIEIEQSEAKSEANVVIIDEQSESKMEVEQNGS